LGEIKEALEIKEDWEKTVVKNMNYKDRNKED